MFSSPCLLLQRRLARCVLLQRRRNSRFLWYVSILSRCLDPTASSRYALFTRLLLVCSLLRDERTYDTSLTPAPETRNAFPACSCGSLAHSTTALATSSAVGVTPLFLMKSAVEIPREEA